MFVQRGQAGNPCFRWACCKYPAKIYVAGFYDGNKGGNEGNHYHVSGTRIPASRSGDGTISCEWCLGRWPYVEWTWVPHIANPRMTLLGLGKQCTSIFGRLGKRVKANNPGRTWKTLLHFDWLIFCTALPKRTQPVFAEIAKRMIRGQPLYPVLHQWEPRHRNRWNHDQTNPSLRLPTLRSYLNRAPLKSLYLCQENKARNQKHRPENKIHQRPPGIALDMPNTFSQRD